MPSNSTKFLLLITSVGGVLVSVSSNSWLGAWIGLEINLLSFIPLMSNVKNIIEHRSFIKIQNQDGAHAAGKSTSSTLLLLFRSYIKGLDSSLNHLMQFMLQKSVWFLLKINFNFFNGNQGYLLLLLPKILQPNRHFALRVLVLKLITHI